MVKGLWFQLVGQKWRVHGDEFSTFAIMPMVCLELKLVTDLKSLVTNLFICVAGRRMSRLLSMRQDLFGFASF